MYNQLFPQQIKQKTQCHYEETTKLKHEIDKLNIELDQTRAASERENMEYKKLHEEMSTKLHSQSQEVECLNKKLCDAEAIMTNLKKESSDSASFLEIASN